MLLLALIGTGFAQDSSQKAAVQRCLAHWETHPFGTDPSFRVWKPSVRIMGFGSDEVVDSPTPEPELVLFEPNVNVLTKTTWKLHNPNGWYCFHTSVGVLSKQVIDAACSANLADSRSGATVLGRTDKDGGVDVLGETEVHRNCDGKRPESSPSAVSGLPSVEPNPSNATGLVIEPTGVGPYKIGPDAQAPITHDGITAQREEGVLCALWVEGAQHKTPEGIGVGASLALVEKSYGKGYPEQIGDPTVFFPKPGLAMVIDETVFFDHIQKGFPPDTKVRGIRVGGCAE